MPLHLYKTVHCHFNFSVSMRNDSEWMCMQSNEMSRNIKFTLQCNTQGLVVFKKGSRGSNYFSCGFLLCLFSPMM